MYESLAELVLLLHLRASLRAELPQRGIQLGVAGRNICLGQGLAGDLCNPLDLPVNSPSQRLQGLPGRP